MTTEILPEKQPINEHRLSQLKAVAGNGPVLITTHDNPDPDSLASGAVLAALFRSAWNIHCHLVYGGLVARAENKAMLSLLTPEWEQIEVINDLDRYSCLAMVDTQPGAGNNRVPVEFTPGIVIDHHIPKREGLEKVPFVDVRTELGATVSLLYQYLEQAGIEPHSDLATAIFYGIQSDTQGLSRGGSKTDQDVYFKMLTRIDRQKLALIEQAGLPREYFQVFHRGLQSARLYGRAVISYLGPIHRPDFVAEIADLLIRLDGTRAVLCLGHHDETMYLSLRTAMDGYDAGGLIQRVIFPPGNAGGHGSVAGGQVRMAGSQPDLIARKLKDRFLEAMGEKRPGTPIL